MQLLTDFRPGCPVPAIQEFPTFWLIRLTLFGDKPYPRYLRPTRGLICGPNVYPRKSDRSCRAFRMLVVFSFRVTSNHLRTLPVNSSASFAWPRLRIVSIVHYPHPKLLFPPGLPKSLQHPVHVQVRERSFEACASFTRVTACPVALPPFRGLCREVPTQPVSQPRDP